MVPLIICLLFCLVCEAQEKICLNMIVKNESAVIRRCLDSVKERIAYWVIVDTGSTDGTQEIIKEHLKEIPGELYERPWRNFGENRSEAFLLAKGKGDYILFMDADDVLEYEPDFQFNNLTKDLYHMWRGVPGFTYLKPQLVRGNLPWRWVGVTHEYLDCSTFYSSDTLHGVKYVSKDDGASSHDPKKFLKNVALLEDGLKKEPANARYMFYLAESYRDAGEKGKALECYVKRVAMGGWAEEVFWAKFQIAHLMHSMGLPSEVVAEAYVDAHHYRPHRLEPIYYLVEMYNHTGNYAKAYEWGKKGLMAIGTGIKDSLFNMDWIENYGLLFQLSIASYYVGHYQESLGSCDKLLTIKELPESWRTQAEINRAFPLEKLTAKK